MRMRHQPGGLDLTGQLDPSRTALLVVDVQNDFCHPEGVFGRAGYDLSTMPEMAATLQALLAETRRLQLFTVFIRATYDDVVLSPNLADIYHRRGFTNSLCLEGSWGAEWYGEVQPNGSPHEVVITKHRYSAFDHTPLDLYLRSNRIETVILTGVVTSGCVESIARDAFFRNYRVVICADAVADATADTHTASLRKLQQSFGAVADADTIQHALQTHPSGTRYWDVPQKLARRLRTLDERVQPAHTALVLIDLQNDFCHPDGFMGQMGEDISFIQDTLPSIRHLLERARQARVMVIHVKAEYGSLSASEVSMGYWTEAEEAPQCCLPETWGGDFVAELKPLEREPVVVKHRYSAFVDTRLDLLLRSNGIRTVILPGVATHCCVESTARDAAMRDYYVVVPEDGVAVRGKQWHLHEASLEVLGTYFGLVVPSRDIETVWATCMAATPPDEALKSAAKIGI
jgi:nicotinamidase-related amidase